MDGYPSAPRLRLFRTTTLEGAQSLRLQCSRRFLRDCSAATRSSRSSVSGYLRTSSTSAAACGLGLALPYSHFSRVLSLIRSLLAKTAREQRNLLRVSRITFESTSERRWINFVAAQSELAFAMDPHRTYTFQQLAKNITLRHYRFLPVGCTHVSGTERSSGVPHVWPVLPDVGAIPVLMIKPRADGFSSAGFSIR